MYFLGYFGTRNSLAYYLFVTEPAPVSEVVPAIQEYYNSPRGVYW